MTQKELSYVDDAVSHEQSIAQICNYMIDNLADENLLSFIKKEIKKHESLLELLTKLLKEKANE